MRVEWSHPDAVALRAAMTREVRALYAADPASEDRDAGLEVDPASVVLTEVIYDDEPIGHVAVRELDGELEIKRMYVVPERRGGDLADRLLGVVETWARDAGARRLVLHTGDRQEAALAFYARHGYTPIPVYPPYDALAYSRCFEKVF